MSINVSFIASPWHVSDSLQLHCCYSQCRGNAKQVNFSVNMSNFITPFCQFFLLLNTGIALIQELGNILSCPFYVLSDSRNCQVHLKGQCCVNYHNHCPLFLSQISAIKFQLSPECLLILNLLRDSPTYHVRVNSLHFRIF